MTRSFSASFSNARPHLRYQPGRAGSIPSSLGIKIGAPPTDYEIAELALYPGARVNRFEEKAAFTPVPDVYGFATAPVAAGEAVSKSDVVDLTSKMRRRRNAGLDTSGRQLGGIALRLFAAGNHQPSRDCRSHRA